MSLVVCTLHGYTYITARVQVYLTQRVNDQPAFIYGAAKCYVMPSDKMDQSMQRGREHPSRPSTVSHICYVSLSQSMTNLLVHPWRCKMLQTWQQWATHALSSKVLSCC